MAKNHGDTYCKGCDDNDTRRERTVKRVKARLEAGRVDHRWDAFSADDLLDAIAEELVDGLAYVERLRDLVKALEA